MIANKYESSCKACRVKLPVGVGFAVKSTTTGKWFSLCGNKDCFSKSGVSPPCRQVEQIKNNWYINMPYEPESITRIKTIPGATWDPEAKKWSVTRCIQNTAYTTKLLAICKELEIDVPAEITAKAAGKVDKSKEVVARATELGLFQYQLKGVEFLSLHNRALLADEQGLGKTVQALVAAPSNGRVLIVSPAAVKYNWLSEAERWRGGDFKNIEIVQKRTDFRLPERGEILIMTYDVLLYTLFNEQQVDDEEDEDDEDGKEERNIVLEMFGADAVSEITLILDEAHLVKNFRTSRSKRVSALTPHVQNVWALTGTPLANHPPDLFGVLCAANMNVLGSWTTFKKLFGVTVGEYQQLEFGTPSTDVRSRLKNVMLRRLKKDVLKDLPPKIYKDIHVVEIKRDISARLRETLLQSSNCDDEDAAIDRTIEALALDGSTTKVAELAKIRAILAECRIPAMLEIVESYESSETPLLVFSAHRKPIETLSGRDRWGIITGDTPAKQRSEIVQRFQDGELLGVALTIQAGGVGLTLSRASNILFVDLDWTPAMNIQAEDRAHRIGSSTDTNLLIMTMCSRHPVDVHIHNLIQKKMEIIEATLN